MVGISLRMVEDGRREFAQARVESSAVRPKDARAAFVRHRRAVLS